MSGNKSRILALADFFIKCTDDDNIFSATEICEELEKMGIAAERKSIYSDIDALKNAGLDIVCTRSPKRGFFLASRRFEAAEVRLMIDAVQAAKFITARKTNSLVDKIGEFLSEPQAEKLKKQVYIDTTRKCKNEEIYYNIDVLHNAICTGKQVSFLYYHRRVASDLTVKVSERSFTVNPYALIWSNDHYYLVCNNPKYNNLMHTRIDRMKKVTVLESRVRPFSEVSDYRDRFDSADYAGKLFNMFSGTEQKVTMCCSNSILEEIIDRFGSELKFVSRNTDSFTAEVTAVTGEGFISWVLQYGSSIKIISPTSLCEAIGRRAADIARLYIGEKE